MTKFHTHAQKNPMRPYFDAVTNLKEFLTSEEVDRICYAAAPHYLLQTPAQPRIILSQ